MLAKIGNWMFWGCLFAGLIIWAYIPLLEFGGVSYWVLAGLSVVGLILWFIFSLDRLRLWFKKRSTQFGLGLVWMAVMSLLIIGVVNWIAVQKNWKKDLTATQINSLSDQTVNFLAKLDDQISIRVWTMNIQAATPNLDLKGFLENYRIASKGKLNYEVKNPNEAHLEAEKDRVRRNNIIIVRSEKSGREARIENLVENKAEEQFTNAIIEASKGEKKTLCMIAGHGQSSIDVREATGLSTLKESLEQSNYAVKELLLVNEKELPKDCELYAVIGPRGAPLERELNMLKEAIQQGVPFILLLGPRAPKEWNELLQPFGVEAREDLLVDPLQSRNPIWIATRNYSKDVAIVADFPVFSVFPESRSLAIPADMQKDGFQIKAFVSSESYAYSKKGDLKAIKSLNKSSGDRSGPLALGVLIERPASTSSGDEPGFPGAEGSGDQSSWKLPDLIPSAHANSTDKAKAPDESSAATSTPTPRSPSLIVFGSDLFVVNGFVSQAANMDLFMNSVNYLLKDQELMGIRPRDLRQTYLELGPRDIRKVWGFVLIVPGLFFFFAIRAARRKSVLAA